MIARHGFVTDGLVLVAFLAVLPLDSQPVPRATSAPQPHSTAPVSDRHRRRAGWTLLGSGVFLAGTAGLLSAGAIQSSLRRESGVWLWPYIAVAGSAGTTFSGATLLALDASDQRQGPSNARARLLRTRRQAGVALAISGLGMGAVATYIAATHRSVGPRWSWPTAISLAAGASTLTPVGVTLAAAAATDALRVTPIAAVGPGLALGGATVRW